MMTLFGWPWRVLATGHWSMFSAPTLLAAKLAEIAS